MPLARCCGNAPAELFGAHITLGKHMKIRYAPLAVACALMVAASAQAAPVTYAFGGTVDTVVGVPSLSVGNAFTGSFTFESTSPLAPFGGYDTNIVFEATVNGFSFSTTSPCNTCGGVTVNNDAGGSDRFSVSSLLLLAFPVYAPVVGPNLDGLRHYYLTLLLNDSTSTAFSSDTLPTDLMLASFDRSVFALSFLTDNDNQVFASGPLNSLTKAVPVPEPSTSAMVALALGALAFVRRRKVR